MTMRPEDIKNRTFAHALRGYEKDEVRSFLFRVAESSRELHEQLTATEAQLAASIADQQAAKQQATEAAVDWDVPGAGLPTEVDVAQGLVSDDAMSVDAAFEPTGYDAPESGAVDSVDAFPVAPPVETPLPAAEAFVEAPTESLVAAEQSIADRYGAIGDRIADLLRNADISAAEILNSAEHDAGVTRAAAEAESLQVRTDAEDHASQLLAEAESIRSEADAYRDEVMAELASARLEQESALQAARTAAETEVETFRVDSIEEITGLRSDAFVEIDELRAGATTEVDELRTVAQADAEALRESVLAEATASIADNETLAAQSREEAEADRAAARAELEDVRTEVSTLLEQARTQSEFIKQEADEIIRTKVRANFEQAQTRIDVLRNTEVASRERIVLAQSELSSALNRLDSEPLPELDPSASPAVIEEAERRHIEIAGAVADPAPVEADAFVGGHDTDVVDTDVVDADVIEIAPIDAALVDSAPVDTALVESEDDSLSSYFGAVPNESGGQTTGDILSGAFDAPTEEVAAVESAVDEAAFEETVSEPVPVDAFVDAADSDLTDLETDDLPEYTDAVDTDDNGWAVTEISEVESVGHEPSSPVADQAPVEFGELEDAEHVVIESAEYGDLPVRGDVSLSDVANTDVSGSDELPVRNQPSAEVYTPAESFGAASLADALPIEPEAPELGGATEEDALARLVREAMQEAVDSARKND